MTTPTPTSPPRSGPVAAAGKHASKLGAWFRSHKNIVLGAGAAAAVVAFALYERGKNGATTASTGLNAAGTVPGASNAGLIRQLEREVNQRNQRINHLLKNKQAPKGPKPPAPLPRPGHNSYTIHRGDTLARIAEAVYGTSTARAIHRLKLANPLLLTFSATASLNHYAGDKIRVPPLHPGGHTHKPKHPKPKPRRKPKLPRPRGRFPREPKPHRQRKPKPPAHHPAPPPPHRRHKQHPGG